MSSEPENQNTLRVSAGIVSARMTEVFESTESYDFHITLTGVEAKRVAALCAMMEMAMGTSEEDTLAHIVAVGMAHIRSTEEPHG